MPIKPENRARYPKDWPEIRQEAIDAAMTDPKPAEPAPATPSTDP